MSLSHTQNASLVSAIQPLSRWDLGHSLRTAYPKHALSLLRNLPLNLIDWYIILSRTSCACYYSPYPDVWQKLQGELLYQVRKTCCNEKVIHSYILPTPKTICKSQRSNNRVWGLSNPCDFESFNYGKVLRILTLE